MTKQELMRAYWTGYVIGIIVGFICGWFWFSGRANAETIEARRPEVDVAHYRDSESETWLDCGVSLGLRAGLARHDAERTSQLIAAYSVDHSTEFLRYLMAVAYVETRMRWTAHSGADAVGILQVTLEGARSVRGSALPVLVGSPTYAGRKLTLTKLAQPELNVNTGSAYLWLALRDARGDWTQALATYNGGYYALRQLNKNGKLPFETAQYIVQVMHLEHTCGSE